MKNGKCRRTFIMIHQVCFIFLTFLLKILLFIMLNLDVTRYLPFEINPTFYPPPTISIPTNDIIQPVEFNVSFNFFKYI